MTDNHFSLADFQIALKNADFNQRVVETEGALSWLPTNSAGVSVKFFEAANVGSPRLTMLIRFAPGSTYDLDRHHGGEEFLVLNGSLRDKTGQYHPGFYVRNPTDTAHSLVSDDGCQLFLKLGEFADKDQEQRLIDTNKADIWLPGPVAGTRVLPLHMHDTRSVLLIRWDHSAEFKPGLDPQGEELFITQGRLSDAQGLYPTGSWIRNPVAAWQSWQGQAGTIVYYKNGHFPR